MPKTWCRRARMLLLILSVVMGPACESKDPGPVQPAAKAVEVDAAKGLGFVEASQGLPQFGRWRHTLAFGDIDQDGRTDILAPPPRLAEDGEPHTPVAWLSDGKGGWAQTNLRVPQNLAYDYGGICTGDFDGDKMIDIGLAMHGLGLRGLRGLGDLGFEEFGGGLPPGQEFASRAAVSADFNKDGLMDMAALSEGQFGKEMPFPTGLRVCLGSSEGWTCASVGDTSAVGGLFGDQLTTGDMNGDGHLDIAVSSFEHKRDLIVWMNDGRGVFSAFNEGLPRELHYNWVCLVDVDEDGRDDLIASMSGFGKKGVTGIRVFLYRPEGFKEMSEGLPTDTLFFALDAADLDKDGRVEIVGGAGTGGIAVYGFNKGRWEKNSSVPGLPEAGLDRIYGLYCVDLDGDGREDIVVNSSGGDDAERGGVRVFLNRNDKGSTPNAR